MGNPALKKRSRGVCSQVIPALLILAGQAGAQAPAAPVVVSPEVLPDHHVIVRLNAPQAREVRFAMFDPDSTAGMTKGENGVWEATLGPFDSGAYRYGFIVDGAFVSDPRNIETERMQVVTRSILYVPGAAFMEKRKVPHGAVAVVTYFSTVLDKFRRFHIYTPPGYEANQQRYPVLYLLHGANESDDSWSTIGRAGFILDNLIAEGKAVPMIVVMPNGHPTQTPPVLDWPPAPGAPPPLRREILDFPREFATDIAPYVESHYRTIPDRPHRAIAGLSMGGRQALDIAFANLERFSAIGVFSSGIFGDSPAGWEKDHVAALDNPELKNGLKTIWFRTGSDDFLLPVTKATVELLSRHGFSVTFQESAGAHTWVNWRNYLHEFAPQLFRAAALEPAAAASPAVVVDDDGTVHVPAMTVPMSSFLSPEAKAYVTQHLKDMQNPAMLAQENGVPRFMRPYLERQRILYPVDREERKIAGVHAYVYSPKAGISAENRDRVLIELHGGGFMGCWPACAELESMPVAALGKIRVISLDYREGPRYKFPAASEDVAAVYKELLNTYAPQNIGIYGCSAGGMLTAMSVAWFERHDLPQPGAIGIFCAGAGSPAGAGFGGDATYTASPLGEARVFSPRPPNARRGAPPPGLSYLAGADPADPLVAPINSPATLAKFPPTLIITGTRGFELSGALYTHEQLVKLGVDAELHVWEGLFHGFFYNPDVPESQDAYNVMVKFFDRKLGRGQRE